MRAEEIRIVRGCDLSWDEMVGDERRRFCAACRRDVINLSALTEPEAIRVLESGEGGRPACVRFSVEAGEVVLRRPPPSPAPPLAGTLLALVVRHAPPLLPIVAAAGCATSPPVGTYLGPSAAAPVGEKPDRGVIAGRVTDFETGKPLAGVTVVIQSGGGAQETEFTDASGRFTITDLAPAADWQVRFFYSNSKLQRLGVVVAAGATATVDAVIDTSKAEYMGAGVLGSPPNIDLSRTDSCTTVSSDVTDKTPVRDR